MPEAVLDYDHMFDIDGLTVGRASSDWPALISVSGLDVPEFRVSDQDHPQTHGGFFAGGDLMNQRIVEMSVGSEHDYGTAAYQAAMNTLKQVMRPRSEVDEMVLRYRYNGESTRRISVRPTKCQFVWDEISYHGIMRADLQFRAADPLIYDDDETMFTITPPVTTGGLGFPHGFPHGFGDYGGFSGYSSFGSFNNIGNMPTAPWGRVVAATSPIDGWSLMNRTTGEELSLTLTMNPGEWIDFDFSDGTVLLGGTASRGSAVDRPVSRWWKLQPGANVVEIRPRGLGTAFADVYFRSAWV